MATRSPLMATVVAGWFLFLGPGSGACQVEVLFRGTDGLLHYDWMNATGAGARETVEVGHLPVLSTEVAANAAADGVPYLVVDITIDEDVGPADPGRVLRYLISTCWRNAAEQAARATCPSAHATMSGSSSVTMLTLRLARVIKQEVERLGHARARSAPGSYLVEDVVPDRRERRIDSSTHRVSSRPELPGAADPS